VIINTSSHLAAEEDMFDNGKKVENCGVLWDCHGAVNGPRVQRRTHVHGNTADRLRVQIFRDLSASFPDINWSLPNTNIPNVLEFPDTP
jgi:hypothetical protein